MPPHISGTKKVLAAIVAVIFIVVGISFLNEPAIRNLPNSNLNIVAFGDSLVQGVGAADSNDFVSILSRELGRPIINMGKSGDTTATALTRIESAIEDQPKIVIILLGGNDYLRRVPMNETFSNLQKIVDRIHQSGAAILLLGVRGGVIRDTYNSRFKEFAKVNKVGFVPNVLDGLIGNREFMSDQIHPNDAGYRIIANKVKPVLVKMLNTR